MKRSSTEISSGGGSVLKGKHSTAVEMLFFFAYWLDGFYLSSLDQVSGPQKLLGVKVSILTSHKMIYEC